MATQSMRKQASAITKRGKHEGKLTEQRRIAINLLQNKKNIRHIASGTGLSVETVHILNKAIKAAQKPCTQYCDSMHNQRVGRPKALTEHEEQLIVKRFAFVDS